MSIRLFIALVLSSFVFTACPDDPTDSDDLGWISSTKDASKIQFDATSKDAWTYLSFAKGVVPAPEKPEDSLDWDMAFLRYNIKTNGGSSGKGKAAVSNLGPKDLKDTNKPDIQSWTKDEVIADARTDDKRSMNSLLNGWYSYHFFKHELISNYDLYAVHSADGRVALFKIYDYYDDAGTSGKFTITFRFPIETTGVDPSTTTNNNNNNNNTKPLDEFVSDQNGIVSGESNIDARAGKVYFSFDSKKTVALISPQAESNEWDISFESFLLQTNSGSSGPSLGGAQKFQYKDFSLAKEAPLDGYAIDTLQTVATEGEKSTNTATADWFAFDTTTNKVNSNQHVFWVKTAAGKYAKIQILNYYHPDGSKSFYRLRWAYRTDGSRNF